MARIKWWGAGCASALLVLSVMFALFAHPFLAITEPVRADTLVIEGWVPPYVVDGAAREFGRGNYDLIFVSGMASGGGLPPDTADAMRILAASGIDPAKIVAAPAPLTGWNRTSSMARAVRDRMFAQPARPRGVNVVTLGPHARQTRLAYSRMMGPEIPVGVISIPKDDYNADRWWASSAGIRKTTKDFAGWLRELALGLRS